MNWKMKMETENFSETPVSGENSTLCHNSEDDILKEGALGYIQFGKGRTPIYVQCRKFMAIEPHACSQNSRYISEFLTFYTRIKNIIIACMFLQIISINFREPQDIFDVITSFSAVYIWGWITAHRDTRKRYQ